ncbi:Choline transporter-like protein ctl1 [Fulvia fulva]|nr:Choline transporter-like protein ctl1 [Fulvia fulva]KAK4632479.1 Choline transporter-like protein ctl1 [Fulvia fulva]WPV11987.1 Choline transporter-like protein ctl1 [Fulvia fulva]WPV26533.1 Choline transporter-like protein ctl1 [Fulvia fulva]
MFSEYASRFLQQSNARLSLNQDDQRNRSRNPLDRRRQPMSNSRYVQRPGMPNHPYHQGPSASQSRFPFASRLSRQDPQAPLFFSATDDFEEEDANDQHEREVNDMYALQRSRQRFGPSNLTESSELEDDGVDGLEETQRGQNRNREHSMPRGRIGAPYPPSSRAGSMPESEMSRPSSKGKGRLVDVNLNSTIHEEPPESLANLSPSIDPDSPPPAFRPFKQHVKSSRLSSFLPLETDEETNMLHPRPPSTDRAESVPPTVILPTQEPPKHDAFWGNIFMISLFTMVAAFIVIWFQTAAPSSKQPLGDTIYSVLKSNSNMLVWDTLIAVVVALIWLSLLRNYVRVLVFGMLVAMPVILVSFSIYPLVSSFQGSWHGASIQDRAMRCFSFVPALMALLWTWSVVKNRHSLAKAISILEFSTKIIASSPYLLTLGFVSLASIVVFTWSWTLMFERVFLSGRWVGASKFVLYANSWWLGAFFVLQYLWTLGVLAGIQRATTAATVSQWYFHRLAVPQPTNREVVQASFNHATGALFGTVCLSTFLSLLVRLPLIILPGRLSGLLNMCAYWIIPTSLATLTNPLTLTHAAIHSQPLGIAARGLAQLNFVSRTNPSNTLGPRNFNPASPNGSILLPYKLSKLLLQATRYIMSFALGFSSWVRAAHSIKLEGTAGIRGSLYAYIVGMVAASIGFAVLGSIENVVGATVDAAVICWASESAGGRGEAKFCREAGELFGDDEPRGGRVSMA